MYSVLIAAYDKKRYKRYGEMISALGYRPIYASDAYMKFEKELTGPLLRCFFADRRFCRKCAGSYDALLIPGGGDINPKYFNQTNNGSIKIESEIDRMQFYMAEEFLDVNKPVVGICKGMQLINVLFGGTIIQNMSDEKRAVHEYDHVNGKDRIHNVFMQQGVKLSEDILENKFEVNSAHHQEIDRVGVGLNIFQLSEDNVIEGIGHSRMPVVGLQWHPERCNQEIVQFFMQKIWNILRRKESIFL